MDIYTIEIHTYPQVFTIAAKTKDEAVLKAQERFYSVTNGASIYETMVSVEEHV